jgi:hypothetical protein
MKCWIIIQEWPDANDYSIWHKHVVEKVFRTKEAAEQFIRNPPKDVYVVEDVDNRFIEVEMVG